LGSNFFQIITGNRNGTVEISPINRDKESVLADRLFISVYWGNKLPGRQTLYLCLLEKQITWQTDSLSLFIGETNYLADRLFISVYWGYKLPGRQTLL
jgi:hypothetical protein